MARALGPSNASPTRSNGDALTAGSLPPLPQQAQNPSQPSPASAAQVPQAAPAPTHDQTVAALRHFNAVLGQLRGLLQNPDLGKADVKSVIIDGMTKLVSDRMIAPAEAVQTLATVPERPFDQKQWAIQHYAQTVQAQATVLDHHRQTALGTGNYDLENELHVGDSSPDDHMATMQGMMAQHYAGQNVGRR